MPVFGLYDPDTRGSGENPCIQTRGEHGSFTSKGRHSGPGHDPATFLLRGSSSAVFTAFFIHETHCQRDIQSTLECLCWTTWITYVAVVLWQHSEAMSVLLTLSNWGLNTERLNSVISAPVFFLFLSMSACRQLDPGRSSWRTQWGHSVKPCPTPTSIKNKKPKKERH